MVPKLSRPTIFLLIMMQYIKLDSTQFWPTSSSDISSRQNPGSSSRLIVWVWTTIFTGVKAIFLSTVCTLLLAQLVLYFPSKLFIWDFTKISEQNTNKWLLPIKSCLFKGNLSSSWLAITKSKINTTDFYVNLCIRDKGGLIAIKIVTPLFHTKAGNEWRYV